MKDDLRQRLAASNPVPPSEPVDPVTSDRARALMEGIMSDTQKSEVPAEPRRLGALGLVAAALAVVIGGTAFINTLGGSPKPLALTANGEDAMAMCMVFDPAMLAELDPAFGGTVVALTDSVATIEVDRWFSDGDAEIVEIEYTPGFEALIGTPSLEVGQRYLITATDGVVNGCGYSGLATPDLEGAFEAAFNS